MGQTLQIVGNASAMGVTVSADSRVPKVFRADTIVGRHDRCQLGRGDIPYSEILGALTADGYEGLALAERHYSRQNSSADQSPDLMEEIRAEIAAINGWIQGATSGTGQSRETLS